MLHAFKVVQASAIWFVFCALSLWIDIHEFNWCFASKSNFVDDLFLFFFLLCSENELLSILVVRNVFIFYLKYWLYSLRKLDTELKWIYELFWFYRFFSLMLFSLIFLVNLCDMLRPSVVIGRVDRSLHPNFIVESPTKWRDKSIAGIQRRDKSTVWDEAHLYIWLSFLMFEHSCQFRVVLPLYPAVDQYYKCALGSVLHCCWHINVIMSHLCLILSHLYLNKRI
jgi:hypothetical protein